MMLDLFDPDDADDIALRESWGRYERHSVSPGTAASMVEMINATDIRGILPATRVPTLVVARADTRIESAHGRYLAERIAGATYVELPGRGSLLWSGDQDALLREIEHFVTGARLRDTTACSRPCSSPTSSARPTARPRSETPDGESSSPSTTSSSVERSTGSKDER